MPSCNECVCLCVVCCTGERGREGGGETAGGVLTAAVSVVPLISFRSMLTFLHPFNVCCTFPGLCR